MASKGKKSKVKFQWTKELGFLIAALVAVIAATVLLSIPTKSEKLAQKYNEAITNYNIANSQSGASIYTIPAKHVFEEIEFEEIDELVETVNSNQYTFVVYGSENNATFLQQLYTLNTYAEEYEIETIYIYSSLWVEEQEDLQAVEEKLVNYEKQLLGSDLEEFTFTTYPTLLVFETTGEGEAKKTQLVFNSQDAKDITSWTGYMDYAFAKYNNKAE